MKELLTKKLLEARSEFLSLKDKENYEMFFVLVDLNIIDNENANVVFKFFKIPKNQYTSEEFGSETQIKTTVKDYVELLKYAEERYLNQFSYEVSGLISCMYGDDMCSEKFEYIIQSFADSGNNSLTLSGNFGFIISETIF